MDSTLFRVPLDLFEPCPLFASYVSIDKLGDGEPYAELSEVDVKTMEIFLELLYAV